MTITSLLVTLVIATSNLSPSFSFEPVTINTDSAYVNFLRDEAKKLELRINETDQELIVGAKTTCNSISKNGMEKMWNNSIEELIKSNKEIHKSAIFKGINLALSIKLYCPEHEKALEEFLQKNIKQSM